MYADKAQYERAQRGWHPCSKQGPLLAQDLLAHPAPWLSKRHAYLPWGVIVQGVDEGDVDLPTKWEGKWVRGFIPKFFYMFFYILVYAIRPILIRPKPIRESPKLLGNGEARAAAEQHPSSLVLGMRGLVWRPRRQQCTFLHSASPTIHHAPCASRAPVAAH